MKLRSIFLSGLMVALLGCANEPYTGHHPVQRTSNTEMNTFTFIDHNLNRTDVSKTFGKVTNIKHTVKVTIESSGIKNTATGTIEVWAMLRNRTDYDLQIEGMASFYDSGKTPLDDRSSWKRIMIPANGTALYKESSLTPDAVHFLVELREGR